MKKLLILRHAHSTEKQQGQSDKFRELSREGIKGAIKIGTFVRSLDLLIDSIISSTATRALATATIVADAIGIDPKNIAQVDELYMASLKSLLEYLKQVSDDFSTIVLVGHNPHLSYLAEYLCKEDVEHFEPGGLVILSFKESKWSKLSEKSGDVTHVTAPSLLD